MVRIKTSELTPELMLDQSTNVPIVICSNSSRVHRVLQEAGYSKVEINKDFAKALLEYASDERLLQVEKILRQILHWRSPVLVTNFEMLFDPRYKIDVIRLFYEKARYSKVAIQWPGKINGDVLSYASPSDADYYECNCESLLIRVVQ